MRNDIPDKLISCRSLWLAENGTKSPQESKECRGMLSRSDLNCALIFVILLRLAAKR